jgi:hypothetical protein
MDEKSTGKLCERSRDLSHLSVSSDPRIVLTRSVRTVAAIAVITAFNTPSQKRIIDNSLLSVTSFAPIYKKKYATALRVFGDHIMDIGKITQLAKDEFGAHTKCVYHQDRTGPPTQNHLKVDDIGAGDFIFVDSGINGSNPQHSQNPDGLLLSVERPVATGNMGSWAAANVRNVQLPAAFLLVAVFERPSKTPPDTEGVYAPSLLMNTASALMGATSQFRPAGVRLNLPGTNLNLNRPPIDPELQDKIVDPQHPSDFCLALKVDRAAAPVAGKAWLFVGNKEGDSVVFNFTNLDGSTQIFDLRAGIGTANGIHYRASVYLLRFQIWAPGS